MQNKRHIYFDITEKKRNFATKMDNKKATLELGEKPVGRLLAQYALPAIVAMIASSLYNMVDSIFIGQGVGALAIAGLAITFPFMNLSGAFGAAIGIGSSTLISVRLGEKNYATAQNLLGNNVTMNVIIGIVFATVCLLFLDPILYFFGASEQTLPYAREYMEIILAGNVVTHLYFGMNAVLRAASKPKMAMYLTMFTVALNTVLDPLFIYGFGWGIRGAAWATVISQFLAMCWQFYIFCDKKELLHLRRSMLPLKGELVKGILGIGISPFAMNACACLVVIFINNALSQYGGDMAVGAYGIGNRLVFVFIMVTIGINQGMQPIAGYNYGAKKYERMLGVVRYSMYAASVVTTVGWIVCEFFPETCVRMFTSDPELVEVAVHGLKINVAVLPIIGAQIVITNFFQSIGKAKISIFLSLSRQMIFLIPMLVILPPFLGVDGVWWALPGSDAAACVITTAMMVIYMRKFRRMIDAHEREESITSLELSAESEQDMAVLDKENENLTEAPKGMAPWASHTPRYSSMNS